MSGYKSVLFFHQGLCVCVCVCVCLREEGETGEWGLCVLGAFTIKSGWGEGVCVCMWLYVCVCVHVNNDKC